jgi:hypothetical protein
MEVPSKMWESFIKESGSAQKAVTNASQTYLEKYTKGSKAGEVEYRGEPFKAGTIYCFAYVNEKRTNNRPLFLSMGGFAQKGTYMETGIDLQLAPSNFRGLILDRFQHAYAPLLDKNVKAATDGKQTQVLPFTWSDAVRTLGKCGWQTAATAFDRSKIRQVSILDYDDWGTVIGMQTGVMSNIPKAYSDYIRKAQAKLEKEAVWDVKQEAEKKEVKKDAAPVWNTPNNKK